MSSELPSFLFAQQYSATAAGAKNGKHPNRTSRTTTLCSRPELPDAGLGANRLSTSRVIPTAALHLRQRPVADLGTIGTQRPHRCSTAPTGILARLDLTPGYVATGNAEAGIAQEQLEPGDWIIMHTGGITEARDQTGTFFGEQRLTDFLEREAAAQQPPPRQSAASSMPSWTTPAARLDDDATILLARWQPPRP
jgi:hypothetical protein